MDHDLGPLEQIPLGEGRAFRVGDLTLAVFRTRSGGVHATQAACPHRQGPLADGLVGGTTLVCPLHDRAWDLRDGSPLGAECAINVYPIRTTAARSLLVSLPD